MLPKRVNAALETSTLVMAVVFAEHQREPCSPAWAGDETEQALEMLLSIWLPEFWGFLSCSQPYRAGPAVLDSVDRSHLKIELG